LNSVLPAIATIASKRSRLYRTKNIAETPSSGTIPQTTAKVNTQDGGANRGYKQGAAVALRQ